jgi:hypothetical protein
MDKLIERIELPKSAIVIDFWIYFLNYLLSLKFSSLFHIGFLIS